MLIDIIKKNVDFHWNEKTQTAFDELKTKFVKESVLSIFNSKLENIVKADASNREIEEVYSQKNNEEHWKS